MKNILFTSLMLVLLLFTACKKDDPSDEEVTDIISTTRTIRSRTDCSLLPNWFSPCEALHQKS